jgi:hypothetical protein
MDLEVHKLHVKAHLETHLPEGLGLHAQAYLPYARRQAAFHGLDRFEIGR